jgi:hypothetical protein
MVDCNDSAITYRRWLAFVSNRQRKRSPTANTISSFGLTGSREGALIRSLIAVVFCSLILIDPPNAWGESANSVVLGSCNIVQQNIVAAEGSTIINQVDCVPPDVTDTFILRYMWIDEAISSLFVAGYFDSSLKPLIGTTQTVLRNKVLQNLTTIVKRFGDPVRNESTVLQNGTTYSVTGLSGSASIGSKTDRLPFDVLRKLKIYDNSLPILLPDTTAISALLKSTGWPPSYRMTVTGA